jgi:hypothetical protein
MSKSKPSNKIATAKSDTFYWLFACVIFLPWRWSQNIPPKRCAFYELHSITTQKTVKLSLGLINYASCHEYVWGSGDIAPAFFSPAPDAGEWSASRSCSFISGETAFCTHRRGGLVESRNDLEKSLDHTGNWTRVIFFMQTILNSCEESKSDRFLHAPLSRGNAPSPALHCPSLRICTKVFIFLALWWILLPSTVSDGITSERWIIFVTETNRSRAASWPLALVLLCSAAGSLRTVSPDGTTALVSAATTATASSTTTNGNNNNMARRPTDKWQPLLGNSSGDTFFR